jgi:hypothetical protein
MEVMLAATLGMIVVFACFALFEVMDRAKKIQSDRLEANTEMATAHRVMQQAFRSLLMKDAANVRDDDVKQRIAENLRDAEEHPYARDTDAANARFSLQPDVSALTADGQPTQSLELTLVTPPIHAVSMLSDAEKDEARNLREMLMQRQRQLHLWDDSSSSSSSSKASADAEGKDAASASATDSTKSADAAAADAAAAQREADRAARLEAAAKGLTGKDANPAQLDEVAASRDDMEAPRAPGLRGIFELRPEDDPKVLARLRDAHGPDAPSTAMALWWRQIPVDDGLDGLDDNGNTVDPQLLDLARRARADSPQIKLLTGLSSAHWQVYRRRKMYPKMSAIQAKELPAYVEFQFETIGGRHEDWLFEVAWSYGPDPGTVLANNDILAGPADAVAGAGGVPTLNGLPVNVQNLINQAVAQGTPNGSTPSAGAGGSKGSSIVGNTGSQSSRPVSQTGGGSGGSINVPAGGANGATQAEIDAILRQFGFKR